MKRLFIYIYLGLSLNACQVLPEMVLKQPTFNYSNYKVREVTKDYAIIDTYYQVDNPNPFEIDGLKLDYELFLEQKAFLAGNNIALQQIKSGQSELVIPVQVAFDRLLPVAKGVGLQLMQKNPQLNVDVAMTIHGVASIPARFGYSLSKNVKHDKTFTALVPIPKQQLQESTLELLQSLF